MDDGAFVDATPPRGRGRDGIDMTVGGVNNVNNVRRCRWGCLWLLVAGLLGKYGDIYSTYIYICIFCM